jgi:hypothetical protein
VSRYFYIRIKLYELEEVQSTVILSCFLKHIIRLFLWQVPLQFCDTFFRTHPLSKKRKVLHFFFNISHSMVIPAKEQIFPFLDRWCVLTNVPQNHNGIWQRYNRAVCFSKRQKITMSCSKILLVYILLVPHSFLDFCTAKHTTFFSIRFCSPQVRTKKHTSKSHIYV